ncbi:MAG TPA: hypothetical protein VFN35_28495 [Ktedonobacteraceae bacterium]|nr:hypothetical protein [Ktedonobacteraceae bacterium]
MSRSIFLRRLDFLSLVATILQITGCFLPFTSMYDWKQNNTHDNTSLITSFIVNINSKAPLYIINVLCIIFALAVLIPMIEVLVGLFHKRRLWFIILRTIFVLCGWVDVCLVGLGYFLKYATCKDEWDGPSPCNIVHIGPGLHLAFWAFAFSAICTIATIVIYVNKPVEVRDTRYREHLAITRSSARDGIWTERKKNPRSRSFYLRLLGSLSLLGGTLQITGCFLPFVSSGNGFSHNTSGVSLVSTLMSFIFTDEHVTGIFDFIAIILAILLLITILFPLLEAFIGFFHKRQPWSSALSSIAALAGCVEIGFIAWFFTVSLNTFCRPRAMLCSQAAPGLWFVCCGFALSAICAIATTVLLNRSAKI